MERSRSVLRDFRIRNDLHDGDAQLYAKRLFPSAPGAHRPNVLANDPRYGSACNLRASPVSDNSFWMGELDRIPLVHPIARPGHRKRRAIAPPGMDSQL